MRLLLLGGTTEAGQMARALAEAGIAAVYSYAGRTKTPVGQPLPTREGGFGGVAGLREYLRRERITHVVDATHPFASQMSSNAAEACTALNVPLIRLERAPWSETAEDTWQHVPTLEAAPAALPAKPERIFLAIGRQNIDLFAAQPQHHYLLRLVDPPEGPLPLPNTTVIVDRGPFDFASDLSLLRTQRINRIVAKNAGGSGAFAKIAAARALGLPVLMVDRPALPDARTADSVEQVMDWLSHSADLGV